jgi:hypothetical protein
MNSNRTIKLKYKSYTDFERVPYCPNNILSNGVMIGGC